MDFDELAADITDVGRALGLLTTTPGGATELNGDFFAHPGSAVARIVADRKQRAALLDALDGLLPPVDPAQPVRRHPLVTRSGGELWLTVERTGSGTNLRTAIGLAAEIRSGTTDAAVSVDLPLLSAVGDTATATAATTDGPLALRIRLPLPGGGRILASLLFVAEPLSATRFVVRVEPTGGPALELDPLTLPDALGRLVASLLTTVFATLDPDAAPAVRALAEHLPALLGLGDGLPEFPFERLASDGSVRGWLAQLAASRLGDGRSALAAWLSHLGALLGAPITGTELPTEAQPLVLRLTPASAPVTLDLLVGVRDVPADRGQALIATLRAGVPSTATDAVVSGEAVLLVLPLSGTRPATLLERLDLAVRAPGSDTDMLYRSTGGPDIHVRTARAGLRYDGTTTTPILELVDVALGEAGNFATLDLTDTHTLTTAAQTALENAIRAGLGDSGTLVDALLVLVGLGQTPGVDTGRLTTAPAQAIADYYRRLRDTDGGWPRLLGAVSRLLGHSAEPAIEGTGTRLDPWRVSLAHLPAPEDAVPTLWLTLWDDTSPDTGGFPRLRLGLRLAVNSAADAEVPWELALDSEFVGVDLAPGGGPVHWLGTQALRGSIAPLPTVTVGTGTLSADGISGTLAWSPGAALETHALVRGLRVTIDGDPVLLGDLHLPPDRPVLDDPALGLGVDAEALWQVVRLLLGRALESWGGVPGVVLATLAGLGRPAELGLPADLPPLALPVGGDLRSLLDDPFGAWRPWFAALAGPVSGLAASGAPMLDSLRGPLQALLIDNLPAFLGLEQVAEVPPGGSGAWGNPWTVPLHRKGEAPVELLAWLDPDGPPLEWGDPVHEALRRRPLSLPDDNEGDGEGDEDAERGIFADEAFMPDSEDVIGAFVELAPFLGNSAAVDPGDPAAAAGTLNGVIIALQGTDGLVPADATSPAIDGWTGAVRTVTCAHHLLPGSGEAVAAIHDQIAEWTAASTGVVTVLLAPDLAGAGCWQPYLDRTGVTDARTIDLRVPGITPANVDLGAVAAASHYVLNLADDGTGTLDDVTAQLDRVMSRIATVRPGARFAIVAHSYTGLVAWRWVGDHAEQTLGLVTLGAALSPFELFNGDLTAADGIRLLRRLTPSGFIQAPALDDALDFLSSTLDGYRLDGTAAPFPADAFRRSIDPMPDLGDVPVLAIGGLIEDHITALLADEIDQLAFSAPVPADPTHLGYGVRIGLPLPDAAEDDPPVTATLRLDLGSAGLAGTGVAAPQPLTRLLFTATIGDASSWLLGGPGDGTTQPARARAAEIAFGLGTDEDPDTGEVFVDGGFAIRMYDVALAGSDAPVVDLDDPRGVPLLAALIPALDARAAAGGRLRAVLDTLAGIGLLRTDPTGALSVSADALQALIDDPAGYLAPLLPALLDRPGGLLGVVSDRPDRPLAGPWRAAMSGLPVELLIERDPWRVTVHTTGDGLHTAGTGRLVASGGVRLSDMDATTTGRLSVAGLSLVSSQPGTLDVTGSWLDAPLRLVPPDPAALRAALAPLVPRLLVDAGLTVLMDHVIGDGFALASVSTLLARPADWLLGTDAFGDGTALRPDVINDLLGALAEDAGLDTSDTAPLVLPGGFVLAAGGTPNGVRLGVSTPEPLDLGGLKIAIAGHADIDRARHASPGGEVSIEVPLPDGAGWNSVVLRLGADRAGLALAVDLAGAAGGGGTTTVRLLPNVSGLADLLAAGATRLLPSALDTLVNALPDTTVKAAVLDVASALDIYDPALAPNGFANPASQAHLISLAADLAAGRADLATVVNRLLRLLLPGAAIPGDASSSVGVTLPGVLGGTLALAGDLGTSPPSVSLAAQGIGLGIATADATLGYSGDGVTASTRISASIDTGKGVVLTPRLDLARDADGTMRVDLRPLGGDDLVVALAPQVVPPTLAQVARLAEHWAIPLAANVVVDALGPWLDRPVWTSAAKTVRDLLVDSGLIDRDGHLRLVPLPKPADLALAGLRALRGLPVNVTDDLALSIAEDTARGLLGVQLAGRLTLTGGDRPVVVDLGLPSEVTVPWPDGERGVTLFLLDASGGTAAPAAVLRLGGFGVAMKGIDGRPLIDTSLFRLGAAGAYLRTELVFTGPDALRRAPVLDGAVLLTGLGFPIASGAGSANPVAASLLRRQAGDDGDGAAVNPSLDLLIATVDGQFAVRFDGDAELVLPVRESLGPLYVDALELEYRSDPSPGVVGAGVTGGVQIGPLSLAVSDLRLLVPLRSPADLDTWGLDLGGLALGWDAGPVNITGSLGKTVTEDGAVTYDGALAATIAGRRLAAVGSYAKLNSYSSLFVFLAYPQPLGGPPYFYVLGIAAGAGYNRRLTPPRDPAAVSAFPLVAALAEPAPSSPVTALTSLSRDMPPRRGSYWIAAGLTFTTFGLIHSTALAYAALDRGVEIGLLGLSRLALPPDDDAALVSVELALAAHYSTVDQVLAVRAALTRNSWLISRDCQLTGGFALIAWLNKPDVLLTIGGYHPRFVRPPEYPEVERVGFRWEVGHGVVVKGESYFAVMHSALMFGGSLEASYTAKGIRIWFRAGLDVILYWDPLRYEVEAFVSVGVAAHIEIKFIFTVTFDLSLSIGARLALEGPPLHGTVTVDLSVITVTVAFGAAIPLPYLTWPEIRIKYLGNGEESRPVTNGVVSSGLRPGGTGPISVVAPVFRLRFESAMPASAWRLATDTTDRPSTVPAPAFVNAVPAGGHLKPLRGTLTVGVDRRVGDQWVPLPGTDLAALVATTTAGSFPTSLWSTTPADPKNDQPALARVEMLGALGGLELAADSAPHEATGALGDHAQLSLSTLVEEETPRPLPLPGQAFSGGRRVSLPASVSPARTIAGTEAPTLRSVNHRPGPRAWRAMPTAPTTKIVQDALPAGTTQLWDLPTPAAAERLNVNGANDVRAIALSATGAPLGLRRLPGGRLPAAPPGTARLAIRRGGGRVGRDAGWDLGSELLPVASGTLLAADAVVLTAHPFQPPSRYRGGAVPAVVVTSAQQQLTTVLPGDCREILVHLDRRRPGEGSGDLVITCDPEVLDDPEVLVAGDRATLRYRVRGVADQISLTVASAADWWPAGVLGTRPAGSPNGAKENSQLTTVHVVQEESHG